MSGVVAFAIGVVLCLHRGGIIAVPEFLFAFPWVTQFAASAKFLYAAVRHCKLFLHRSIHSELFPICVKFQPLAFTAT
jgi:hypothetical protein